MPFTRLAPRIVLLMSVVLFLQSRSARADDDDDAQASHHRPNIVIILADDLGFGDAGCYNANSKIPTPHVDRLAAQGMRFTDAHSPSAVCTPTRYGLLTGRYAWRTRMKTGVLWTGDRLLIEPGRETIASMLRSCGYTTACIGKWHLGFGAYDPERPEWKVDTNEPVDTGPHTVGFEYSLVLPSSLDIPPYLYIENGAPAEPATETVERSKRRWSGGGGFWRKGPCAPGFRHEDVLPTFTDKAVQFIRTESEIDVDRPFFLYMPLTAPHTPWVPTDDFQGGTKAGWYGDFVAQVDHTVGQVMTALDRHGFADNTLIIVTSDNGSHWRQKDVTDFGHRANGPWRGQKADIFEGGHRVPFIVRWPGNMSEGKINDALIGLNDLYATIADIVDHAIADDQAEDSESFLDALKSGDGGRANLIVHSIDGMFAIREGDWKLIDGLGSGGFTQPKRIKAEPGEAPGQLYNLRDDPGERNNVYLDHPEIVKRLRALLEKHRTEGRSRP